MHTVWPVVGTAGVRAQGDALGGDGRGCFGRMQRSSRLTAVHVLSQVFIPILRSLGLSSTWKNMSILKHPPPECWGEKSVSPLTPMSPVYPLIGVLGPERPLGLSSQGL